MMVKIFVRPGCPKCPPAETLAENLKKEKIEAEVYNLNEPEGLTEGTLYNVMGTPTIIILDNNDQEIISWRGETPTLEEVKKNLQNN